MAKAAAFIHGPRTVKRSKVKLFQNRYHEWLILFEEGDPLPATDVCVNLWLDLQEANCKISALQAQNALAATD